MEFIMSKIKGILQVSVSGIFIGMDMSVKSTLSGDAYLNHCYYDCLEKIVTKLKWKSNDNVFHLETKYKYEDQDKYIHLIFADSYIKHCSGKYMTWQLLSNMLT